MINDLTEPLFEQNNTIIKQNEQMREFVTERFNKIEITIQNLISSKTHSENNVSEFSSISSKNLKMFYEIKNKPEEQISRYDYILNSWDLSSFNSDELYAILERCLNEINKRNAAKRQNAE